MGQRHDTTVRTAGRRRTRALAAACSAAGLAAVAATTVGAGTSGAAPHAGPARATAAAAKGFKACEVTDTGGIHDESFNQSAYQGMTLAASQDRKITSYGYLPSTSASDYTPNISKFVSEGCGIIVTIGFDMATATQSAAKKNPSQKFAIVDFSYSPAMKNVLGLTYQTNQDAFLGGYLAAAMSKTGAVGTFGGQNIPPVTIYMDGFVAGVRYYDKINHKSVKALGWTPKPGSKPGSLAGTGLFTGNFTSSTDGYTDAKALMSQGADVIFPVAGAVGLGAAQAVKAQGKGYYMEWVDTDGCKSAAKYCSLFLTSVTKGVQTSVHDAVIAAANGTFKGGTYVGTLKNGGVALAPYHQFARVIPMKLQNKIKQLKQMIIAGKLSVAAVSYPAPK